MTVTSSELTNWAGNVVFRPRAVHRPTSVAALQSVVAGASALRVLGSGHSFNRIVDTPGDLVVLTDLPPTVEIDTGTGSNTAQARVAGALRYGEIVNPLHAAGFAVANLGSLPHISVAGACATGTHGSGRNNRVLSSSVAAVELVCADGQLATVRRGEPGFEGSVLALGCLGVVTHLTLDLVETFDLSQVVRTGLTRDALHEHLAEILDSAYSVSVFTDHQAASTAKVWQKRSEHTEPVPEWFGTVPATGPLNPVPGQDPDAATTQGGIVGPWHERLPHFRLEHTPSNGDELQSEYFVAREDALAALVATESLAQEMAPLLLVAELRTVAADELWLSPAYQRDSVALHFTWRREPAAVAALVGKLEAALDGLEARPHWGKVNTVDPAVVRGRFPRLADARALVHAADPGGKLRNSWVSAYLG